MRSVYAIRDSAGCIRYVGCSNNPKIRNRNHWKQRAVRNSPFYHWLRTLDSPPDYEVLEEVEDCDGDGAEAYWIAFLKLVGGVNLLNVTTGGLSYKRTMPKVVPTTARQKARETITGMKRSPETRERMRQAALERWRKQKIREGMGSLDDSLE